MKSNLSLPESEHEKLKVKINVTSGGKMWGTTILSS